MAEASENSRESIRQPAVAGLFYPGGAAELAKDISRYLADAKSIARAPKALIAPHAGYMYSGAVAACAYASLQSVAAVIERVVLLGPSHHVAFAGLALSSAGAFETPLGRIPLDKSACGRIRHLPQVRVLDEAHAMEHSLEVHLPFLQTVLEDFRIVPLVVGDAMPGDVAEVLDILWGGRETLIVVSSDLSHYHDYRTAQNMDAVAAAAIERLDAAAIGTDSACGCRPLNGLLTVARRMGLVASVIDLRNSGDTAGGHGQVVGYGAFAFHAT